MNDRLKRIVRTFAKARIAVVGDYFADRYIHTRPNRLSREAPVMICRYEGEELIPGGAGSTAINILALGASLKCVGIVGSDALGRQLREAFSERGASIDSLLTVRGRATTTKTRILSGDLHTIKQQVIRIDRQADAPPSDRHGRRLARSLETAAKSADAVIASDYQDHVMTPIVIETIERLSRQMPVVVDSRTRLAAFRGGEVATPNEAEAYEAAWPSTEKPRDLKALGARLLQAIPTRSVLMTRGNQGMVLFEAGRAPFEIPIVGGSDIVDVTGAGDTVAATVALSLVSGATLREAAWIANCAASVTVMKEGAAGPTRRELIDVVESVPRIRT